MDKAWAIGGGITAPSAVELGALQGHTHCLGPLWPRLHARRASDPGGRLDGRHGDRRDDVARVARARAALRALLGCGPRRPETSTPVWAPVLGPAPCRPRSARCVATARGRTGATNAGPRAPSAAHGAKPLERVV